MQGFISYSHNDHKDFKTLQRDLASIEHGLGVKFWSDERLTAGYSWHDEILNEIRKSKIFLMLVSPAYFASKYIIDHELTEIRALQRIEDRLLIPVILGECDWMGLLGKPQAVPVNDQRRLVPIRKWIHIDDGFNAARAQIKTALEVKFNLKTISLIDFASTPVPIKLLTQSNAVFLRLQKELRIIEKVASAAAYDSCINQPGIRDPLQRLGKLATRIANSGQIVPGPEIFDQLVSLRSLIRCNALTSVDPDSEDPVNEQLRAREGLGNILLSVEAAIDAARDAGYESTYEQDSDALPRVPKSEVITEVDQITSKIDLVQQQVDELRQFAETHALNLEQQTSIVDHFSDRMDASIDLALHELGHEQGINFGAVSQNIDGMQELSKAFVSTTEGVDGWFLPHTQTIAAEISKYARAAGDAVRQTIKKLKKVYKSVYNSEPNTGYADAPGLGISKTVNTHSAKFVLSDKLGNQKKTPVPQPTPEAQEWQQPGKSSSVDNELQNAMTRILQASKIPHLPPSEYHLLFSLIAIEVQTRRFALVKTSQAVFTRAQEDGLRFALSDITFVLKAINDIDPWLEHTPSIETIARAYQAFVLARCSSNGIKLTKEEYLLIQTWFGLKQSATTASGFAGAPGMFELALSDEASEPQGGRLTSSIVRPVFDNVGPETRDNLISSFGKRLETD